MTLTMMMRIATMVMMMRIMTMMMATRSIGSDQELILMTLMVMTNED